MYSGKLKSDLISIIMPAYNCERYILKSIDSVIKQSYKNWELIIIDDGSTDATKKISTEAALKDTRIRYYENKDNIGVSATRNKGIALAEGEWIAFLDSDDMWTREKLEKQICFSNEIKGEFIFTGSSYIDEKGSPYRGIFEVPRIVNYQLLKRHNVISCSSVLIKKKFFTSIKMEKDDMHEDYAVWLRVLKQGVEAYGYNEPLLIYRISKTSKSGDKKKTLKMTYKVYRFLNINPFASIIYTLSHIIGSIKKYKKIKNY